MLSASSLRASLGFQHFFPSLTYLHFYMCDARVDQVACYWWCAHSTIRTMLCPCVRVHMWGNIPPPQLGGHRMLLGVCVQTCWVSFVCPKWAYKGKSFFQLLSAVLGSSHLETGSPGQQLCLPVPPMLCFRLPSSSGRTCQKA